MKSKFIFKERGQALIVIALSAVVLFGFVGLAVDGSAIFSDRRHAQNAADTAALAAALAKVNKLADAEKHPGSISTTPEECPPPSGSMSDASDVCVALVLAGLDRADSNGYDSTAVKIYSPPISGYYTGNTDYVQVIITSLVKTTFMQIFGFNQKENIMQATTLAKPGRDLAGGNMIISFDPSPNCSGGSGSGGYSVEVGGSGTLNLNGGGIFVNSHETCGYRAPNCPAVNITSGTLNSRATVDNIDQCTSGTPVPEKLNQRPYIVTDDIDAGYPPVPPECSIAAPTPNKIGVASDGKDEWLIHPGFYTDFPQASLIPNNKHIYMESGVYCIDPPGTHDLSWSGSSFLELNASTDASKNKHRSYNPDGVTLYIRSGGGFSLSINSPILLDATTSTTSNYRGYLIVLEGNQSSIENCVINGGSYLDINGLIYAPYCNITVNGGSEPTAVINAQLMGWDLKLNGNNTITFNYNPGNQVKIKRKIGLMK